MRRTPRSSATTSIRRGIPVAACSASRAGGDLPPPQPAQRAAPAHPRQRAVSAGSATAAPPAPVARTLHTAADFLAELGLQREEMARARRLGLRRHRVRGRRATRLTQWVVHVSSFFSAGGRGGLGGPGAWGTCGGAAGRRNGEDVASPTTVSTTSPPWREGQPAFTHRQPRRQPRRQRRRMPLRVRSSSLDEAFELPLSLGFSMACLIERPCPVREPRQLLLADGLGQSPNDGEAHCRGGVDAHTHWHPCPASCQPRPRGGGPDARRSDRPCHWHLRA